MDLQTLVPERFSDFRSEDVEAPDDVEVTATETALVAAAAIGAGILTRGALKAMWRRARKSEPPENPSSSEVTWTDALLWSAAAGAAVGIARVISRRGATAMWRKFS